MINDNQEYLKDKTIYDPSVIGFGVRPCGNNDEFYVFDYIKPDGTAASYPIGRKLPLHKARTIAQAAAAVLQRDGVIKHQLSYNAALLILEQAKVAPIYKRSQKSLPQDDIDVFAALLSNTTPAPENVDTPTLENAESPEPAIQ